MRARQHVPIYMKDQLALHHVVHQYREGVWIVPDPHHALHFRSLLDSVRTYK